MKLRNTLSLPFLLLPWASLALAQDAPRWQFSGNVTPAGQITNNPESSKFNEYRDLEDGVFIQDLGIDAVDNETGLSAELRGFSLFRDDKNVRGSVGKAGQWRLSLEWDELPHRLSNKAMTVFRDEGGGTFTVPTTVPVASPAFVKDLAPAANSTTLRGTNDPLVGAYLNQLKQATPLENERRKGSIAGNYALADNLNFRLGYSTEARDGNKITYGAIGDRPPRSLNVQFTEPLDYRTQEFKFESDYGVSIFQLNVSYLLSDFKNKIDTLNWQNIYTSPTGTQENWTGATPRSVATFGRRPLMPDNRYHNPAMTLGIDLPFDSRFTGTASWGFMRQDETLLPYSTSATTDTPGGGLAWNDPAKLPRQTADGRIDTRLYDFRYTLMPISRMNVTTFYRYYDLNNMTPPENWRYVTQDTTNTNGAVAYLNKRRNVPFSFNRQNFGIDPSYSFGAWRTTLGLGVERELIEHRFREANTAETKYRASLRTRPLDWLSFRTKFQLGTRHEEDFNSNPTAQTYWYEAGEVTDNNDPRFAFENHPDTRQFDVADRLRRVFQIGGTATPLEDLDVSANYRYLNDDFDSNVEPTQPLANYPRTIPGATAAADRLAFTPGNQLGLLSNRQHQYTFNVSYPFSDRFIMTALAGQEEVKSSQRGLEFDEMARINPGSISATTEQGPWTRATNQWLADIRDRTNTVGLGASVAIIPNKLKVSMDHLLSLGKIEIAYSGFGAQSSLNPAVSLADNNQYGFRSPSPVKHLRYAVTTSVEYEVIRELVVGLSYLFERYNVEDWQQEANAPWFESVGSENFLRDSSRDWRWGNRLPSLGSYLAPSYTAHVGTLQLSYRF